MLKRGFLALLLAGCMGAPVRHPPDGAVPDAAAGGSGGAPSGGSGGGGGTPSGGTPSSAGGSDAGGQPSGGSGATVDSGTTTPDAPASKDGPVASNPDAPPSGTGGTGGTPQGNVVFVAVGYHAYRVRSTDMGMTWTDDQTEGTDGDNQYLIRGVSWGNGLFVAGRGWPSGAVRTSPDGKTWTNRTAPTDQWMGGVTYIGNRFVAVGGAGYAWTSSDGTTWKEAYPFSGLGMRTVVSGGGALLGAGNGAWYKSMDNGTTWVKDAAMHTASNEIKVAYCSGAFKEIGDGNFAELGSCADFTRCRGAVHAAGIWLRTSGTKIERSTNGTTWMTVHTATASLEDVEVGYVP